MSAFSSSQGPKSLYEHNIKVDNNTMRKRIIHLVCVTTVVVYYSVDKMVPVSLNLNKYRMPTTTVFL